jgi:hypothetical protein
MDDLRELVLLTKDQENEIKELLRLSSRAPQKLEKYYEMLKEGALSTDVEAAAHFFDDAPTNTNYQKLKSDVLKRLIIIFFYLNVKGASEKDRKDSFYRNYFRWSVAVNLLQDGASVTPFALMKEIYAKAVFFEFTDLAQLSAEYLSEYYLNEELDLEQYQFYHSEAERYAQILDMEDEAELLYSKLASERANQRSWTRESNEKAQKAFEQIHHQNGQIDSYRFKLCAYLIESGIYLAQNNFKKVNQLSEEAIRFFKEKPYDVAVPLQIFYYQKLLGHIQLREYEMGRDTAQACLQYLEEGTYNWFKYQEAYFLLLSHTGKYQEAFHLLEETRAHERYTLLPENIREVWNVYTAYISLLAKWEIISVGDQADRYLSYEVERLLDRISIYSKDKEGLNVSVQIVYLLHLIHEGDFEILHIKEEGLKKYSSRYLKKGNNARSALFLKLLLNVHLFPFEAKKFEQKSQKLLEKLNAIPFDISQQSAEVEIIPFEKLWEMVLNTL